jgi:glutamate synthase (ferredoxin)
MGSSLSVTRAPTLVNPRFDHESCGVGFVATLHGASNHHILRLALTALGRLAHRGAVAADHKSSDGVGILTAVPRAFLLKQAGIDLPPERPLAVAMLFLPQDETCETRARICLQECISGERLQWLAWRKVPIRSEVLGEIASASLPVIRQALIAGPEEGKWTEDEIEHRLYAARKSFERQVADSYVCSLSARTIVYKALCAGRLLHEFYPDLQCEEFVTPFAIFHQRYATNVLPSWHRAQPLRMLAHNGEINTIWGNRAHMESRRASLPRLCEPLLSAQAQCMPIRSDFGLLAEQRFHPDFVEVTPLADWDSEAQTAVRELLHQHVLKTGSRLGQRLIENWPETLQQVLRVAPRRAMV